MNGVALLMAAAVLGVDYGWQPTTDGQLEYIIQVEPITLVALRGGQELISQIDPYVRDVRRFRIRVGTEMVPRRGTPPRQPANPQTFPVPAGVQYGWQGIDTQQMEFIIQLSDERIALLRSGEDIVGEIPAEVPNVTRLRVRSGVEPPPRQGLQVASATSPSEQPTQPGQTRELPFAAGSPAPTQGPEQPPLGAGPPVGSLPRQAMENQSPQAAVSGPAWSGAAPSNAATPINSASSSTSQPIRSDVAASPAAGAPGQSMPGQSMPAPAPSPSRYSNAVSDWGSSVSNSPPAQPASQFANDSAGSTALQGPVAAGGAGAAQNAGSQQPLATTDTLPLQDRSNPPSDRTWSGQDFGRWPAPAYDRPGSPAASPSPAASAAPSTGSWSGTPVPASGVPVNSAPPTVQIPQGSAGPPSGWTVSQEPAWGQPPSDQRPAGSTWQGSYTATPDNGGWSGGGYASSSGAGYPAQPASSLSAAISVPLLPWEQRLLDSFSENEANAQAKDFWANLAATANDPSLDYLRDGAQAEAGDRPWGPLALTLMVMFVSLGANLYMGWIAVDMYRRYLDLADDLTELDTASRSSPNRETTDDDPLDDEEHWGEFRRRRERASVAA